MGASAVKLSLHSLVVDPNTNQTLIDLSVKGFLIIGYINGIISSQSIGWQSYTVNGVLDTGGPVKVVGNEYQLHEPNKNIYSSLRGFSLFGFNPQDSYDIIINPGNIPMKASFYSYAMVPQAMAHNVGKSSHGMRGMLVRV